MKKATSLTRAAAYRRCVIDPKNQLTLQQLVATALGQLRASEDRTEPLDAQSTSVRVIGKHKVINGALCGYLSMWERGRSQPVITDDPKAQSLALGVVAPPAASGGRRKEFIPGVLYFAVLGNHVAMMQNATIRGASLESHFAWLLKSKSALLDATTKLLLSDEAQRATKERIRKSHVKSIGFGQSLMGEVKVDAPPTPVSGESPKNKVKETRKFKPSGPIVDLMRSLFNSGEFEKLGLNDIFDGNLDIWIEVRFPKRERSHAENTIRLMDSLAIGLRDMEGDQVSLQLADGHRVSGADLKITGSLVLKADASGVIEEEDAWTELSAWLLAQIKQGVVDPD